VGWGGYGGWGREGGGGEVRDAFVFSGGFVVDQGFFMGISDDGGCDRSQWPDAKQ